MSASPRYAKHFARDAFDQRLGRKRPEHGGLEHEVKRSIRERKGFRALDTEIHTRQQLTGLPYTFVAAIDADQIGGIESEPDELKKAGSIAAADVENAPARPIYVNVA